MNTTTNPQKAIEKIYSLTPMQKGILFHSLENDLSRAYVEQLVVDMEGELDIPALQNAYGHVVHRHSSLRTVFVFGEIDKPRQVVLSSIRPDFTEVTLPAGWQGLEQWLDKDIQRGFDLVKGPLSRITILKSGERQYKFVWTFHHIIFDGWCNGIFFSELFGSYSAFRKGSQPDLGPVQPYGRYIQWLERQDLAPALRFWKENIGDYTGQVTFPGHASLPGEFPAAFGEHILRFSEKKTSDIASLCRSYKVTAAGFFQAAWGVLLSITAIRTM
jgi:hypothetical protein